MRKLFRNLFLAGSFASALLAAGCDEAVQELDELANCTDICNRYDECVTDEFDVPGCIDDCEQMSDMSAAYNEQAMACETCIEGMSCLEDFTCTDECAGVVPPG